MTTTATIVNPPDLHDPTAFGYSHLATVPAGSALVLVAGQYGSDSSGHVVSADFADQVERAFANLAVALAAAGLDFGDVVQLRTFVVDHDRVKLEVLLAKIRWIWGDHPPTQTLLGVAALALPDMQFEVDAVAASTNGRAM